MPQHTDHKKNIEKDLTQRLDSSKTELTDYDVCDLYIRCVSTFVETCSLLDMKNDEALKRGQVLWENTIKARDEYRKEHPVSHETDLKR